MENESLHRQLQESRKKLDSAIELQAQLEMDVVKLAKQVGVLEGQVTDLRKTNHRLENDLSQEQMTNMNEKLQQQVWVNKEAESEKTISQLRSEVSNLKHSLEEQQLHEASLLSSLAPPQFPTHTLLTPPNMGHRRNGSVASSSTVSSFKSDIGKERTTVDKLKNELDMVQQQTEMMSREYAMRNHKIENDLQETKNLVNRLIEENEGFQIELAERIIVEDEEESENRPLRLIIERLVQRLLDFRDFEKFVDVDAESISNFRIRMANARRKALVQRAVERISVVRNPQTWVNLIFGEPESSVSTMVSIETVSTPATSLSSVLQLPQELKRPQMTSQTKLRPLTIMSPKGPAAQEVRPWFGPIGLS